jgi:2-hydroxy-6-oxonona-2,4-dienedioate hydrolase
VLPDRAAAAETGGATMTTVTAEGSSRYVTTKLHRMHYQEAGTGHPVVMLHGSGPGATGWSNFNPNIGPMSERFRVLAFDMPGWGGTEDLDPAQPRDHVEALILALDELGIERATLVGNSMGGMTSIRCAIEHPDRVSHLVPMGAPAPGINIFTAGGGMSEGLKILIEAYMDPSPANFKRLVSVMAFDQKFATDELAEQRSKNALAHPEHLESFGKMMQSGAGMTEFFGLANRLAEISAPTLVIHGRDDRTVSFENGLRLVSAIPNSRLMVFNQCGHWAQLEHADEFNRLLEQFILNH